MKKYGRYKRYEVLVSESKDVFQIIKEMENKYIE